MRCESCGFEFKREDKVTLTDASGANTVVHTDCLYDYLCQWTDNRYYASYEECLETEGLEEDDL